MRTFRVIVYFDKDGDISQATYEVKAENLPAAAKTLTTNLDIAYRMEIHELFEYLEEPHG